MLFFRTFRNAASITPSLTFLSPSCVFMGKLCKIKIVYFVFFFRFSLICAKRWKIQNVVYDFFFGWKENRQIENRFVQCLWYAFWLHARFQFDLFFFSLFQTICKYKHRKIKLNLIESIYDVVVLMVIGSTEIGRVSKPFAKL